MGKRAKPSGERVTRSGIAVAAVAGWLAGAQTAPAQDSEPVTVDLGDCVELETPEARFECYEARVGAALDERETAAAPDSEGPSAARETARAAPESAVTTEAVVRDGDGPRAGETGEADEADEADEFYGTIASLRERVPNSYVITLDNGQVWRQTEPERYGLRPGNKVRIYRGGWADAYRLTVESFNGFIRVERVR